MSEAGAFWLRAVGDNSYVSAVERERERKALFDSVKAALRGLVSAWSASSAPPVWRSDAAEPTAFVSAVARALTHAKKPSSSSSSISAEGAQFGSPEWVCESLNAQALAPRLRAATVADGQLQRQNYADGAFVLDAELMAVLVDALEAVGAMRFELTAAPPQQQKQQQQRQRRRKRRATTVVRVLDEDDVDGAHSAPNPAPVHAALPRREASLTSLTQSADVQPESPDLEEEEEAQQEDEPLHSSPPPSADPVPEETAAAAEAATPEAATAVTPQPEPDQKPLQQQHQRQTSMSYADSLKETEAKLRQRFEQLKAMSRSSLSREEFRHLFDTPPPPKAESPKLPPMPAPEAASTTPEPAQMSSPEPSPAPAPAPAVPEPAEPDDAPKPEPTSTPEPAEDTAPGSPPSTVTIAIDQEDSAERVDLAAKPVSPMATVLHNATAEKKDDKEETRKEASSRLFAEDDGKDQRAAESDAEKEKRIREATFTPFIAESIIIAEYDKRDTRRSLAEIVRSRMEEEQQQRKQAQEGSSQQPAVVVVAAAAVLASSSSSSPPPPSVADATDASIDPAGPAAVAATKPPANWKPELKRLNLYLHTRGQPKAQGNKCFGCGAGMTEARFSSPRYCDFTGRFFCAKCHAGKKSVIPARVLHSWDFTQHPVNNTSLEYLASVEGTTLYDIALLNARLYRTAPVLKDLRIMRKKLFHMHDFVASCTKLVDGDPASTALRDLPRHLWASCETYTLAELCKVDTLLDKLMGVHSAWLAHISACPLCSQKGSICEICHSPKAIFPWELADTVMCTRCHGLFHRACYNKDLCPRCKRRQTRSLRL